MAVLGKKSACVKDVVQAFKLDPMRDSALALQTGADNGASVVFKVYLGVNGVRYDQPVELLKPDNSAAAVTDLTGALKLGIIPVLARGCTDVYVIRTDADASVLASFALSATTS